LLADAEAAEAEALNAAMNAEAEAEVAEGMAYAATDRAASLPGEEQGSHEAAEQFDDQSDVTLKIPLVRPQEHM
jgi:uncharacterized membrane protein YqiK